MATDYDDYIEYPAGEDDYVEPDGYGWEDEALGYEDYEPNPYDGTYSEE